MGQSDLPWGSPVLDTHLHLRADADACYTHIQGCGVTKAVLLTPASDEDRAKAEMEKQIQDFLEAYGENEPPEEVEPPGA